VTQGAYQQSRKPQLRAEAFLLAVIALSAVVALQQSFANGYLPQPFYYLKSDTLMDWYNTAYWANRPGAYDVWHAVYAPLSLDFLKLFSLHGCYQRTPAFARDCDWLGQATLFAFFLVNGWLAFVCYRAIDPATAGLRALALALGFPMLFALERGNLVVPCFTFFMLSEGGLLRRRWQRHLAFAVAVNFKPYLVVTSLPWLVRRKWLGFAGGAAACLGVYTLSFVLEGAGSPVQLVRNLVAFVHGSAANYWNDLYNPTSFIPVIDILFNGPASDRLPLWASRAMLPSLLIGTMVAGLAAVLLCYGAVFMNLAQAPRTRLAAMALAVVLTTTGASGYAEIFLLFLVFFERWDNLGSAIALVSAYLLSIPTDFIVSHVPLGTMQSWVSHREVTPLAGIAVGQFARPALLFVVEFALAAATLRNWRRVRPDPQGGALVPPSTYLANSSMERSIRP